MEYEFADNLTVSDSLFNLEAALDGISLAYRLEQLAAPHIQARRLIPVLEAFSPTFPGFYLYCRSRRNQSPKMKAFVDFILSVSG